jgi:hypothetical protein
MQRASSRKVAPAGWILLAVVIFTGARPPAALAGPYVEFDFVRAIECRDVTPVERVAQYPTQRLVEFMLPVSVRFHEMSPDEVDELTIEINGASAGMRVVDFAPATVLTSDVACPIETTTTTKKSRSLDATLGGQLPLPYGEVAANVSPSVSAGASKGETVTEKLSRLPPKQAIVVSGTSAEGRGVFFKLKRSSQTSLEGVHQFAVTFAVPALWRGAQVHVGCSARGERKLLWVIKQDATLGSEGDTVRLYLTSRTVRQVAKPVFVELSEAPRWIAPAKKSSDKVIETAKKEEAKSEEKGDAGAAEE